MTLTLATGIRSPSLTFPPLRIGENHGGLNLAFGNGPIFPQEPIFILRTNRLKAGLFVKLDCPNRIRPSPDRPLPDFASHSPIWRGHLVRPLHPSPRFRMSL
jgi:hypothetical protein